MLRLCLKFFFKNFKYLYSLNGSFTFKTIKYKITVDPHYWNKGGKGNAVNVQLYNIKKEKSIGTFRIEKLNIKNSKEEKKQD